MCWKGLPNGTAVGVCEGIHQSDPSYRAETLGVIEAWKEEPTGAWHAHGRNGKLWLRRLQVRKSDGEVSVLTIDAQTRVCSIKAMNTEEPA